MIIALTAAIVFLALSVLLTFGQLALIGGQLVKMNVVVDRLAGETRCLGLATMRSALMTEQGLDIARVQLAMNQQLVDLAKKRSAYDRHVN